MGSMIAVSKPSGAPLIRSIQVVRLEVRYVFDIKEDCMGKEAIQA